MNGETPQHRAARLETINVRGLSYNIRHWGPADAPMLFLLHGWMDSSATFQFVVDAFKESWHVIAPDWRGYGRSQWLAHPYWFPDYYADLDCLLAYYSPNSPARVVGHSMGANIASTYAGIRPERIGQLAMVDFLGLKPPADVEAPTQIGTWLKNIQDQPRLRAYKNHDALARQLMFANSRLSESRAAFLAGAVSRVRPDGQIEMACDPWHKVASPAVYRIEDTMACWKQITAPVLMVIAEHGFVEQRFGQGSEEFARRTASFQKLEVQTIKGAGHNVQHDRPEELAAMLEAFFLRDS